MIFISYRLIVSIAPGPDSPYRIAVGPNRNRSGSGECEPVWRSTSSRNRAAGDLHGQLLQPEIGGIFGGNYRVHYSYFNYFSESYSSISVAPITTKYTRCISRA